MLYKLIALANKLDEKGLYEEADILDKLAAKYDKEFMPHLEPNKYIPEMEGPLPFMRDETGQRAPAYLDDIVCDECGEALPLKVLKSGGGYYLGRHCPNCGPYGRESGYFRKEKDALEALQSYKKASINKLAASPSGLIRALKTNNVVDVRKALDEFVSAIPSYSTPEKELGMTDTEYKDFVNSIKAGHLDTAKDIMGFNKPLGNQSQKGMPKASLIAELKRLKSIIDPHRGSAAGKHHTSYLGDRIEVDAGLAFNPNDLVKALEQAGYKQHIKDAVMASRSKRIGKDRIVVDVDISGSAVPTSISLDPLTKENYEAIASVFGGVRGPDATGSRLKELTFDEAVQQYEEYDPPPPQGP